MHLCWECQEYCDCSNDSGLSMQAAPADCAHDCDAQPRQPWVRKWPWDKEEMQEEVEGW